MKAIIGQPIKLNYRNAYEGGLQGPCTAEVIDTTVQPPEFGTVKDGVFTANLEGVGKLVTQFIYPDGSMNNHEVTVTTAKPQTVEIVKTVAPKITGGMLLDHDEVQ